MDDECVSSRSGALSVDGLLNQRRQSAATLPTSGADLSSGSDHAPAITTAGRGGCVVCAGVIESTAAKVFSLSGRLLASDLGVAELLAVAALDLAPYFWLVSARD